MPHDLGRDPCPAVILNDFGGAFAMGTIGGSIWHGIKGARNSVKVSKRDKEKDQRRFRSDQYLPPTLLRFRLSEKGTFQSS